MKVNNAYIEITKEKRKNMTQMKEEVLKKLQAFEAQLDYLTANGGGDSPMADRLVDLINELRDEL